VLHVELSVHAVQQSRRVDLNVHLARVGEGENETVIAFGEASGRAGRGLPEQIEHGAVAVTVPLPIAREAFDAAVSGAERPELVITLAVSG